MSALLERESSCGCPHLTPPVTYGRQGLHYRRSETEPENPQADVAFEPCLAYRRAVAKGKESDR